MPATLVINSGLHRARAVMWAKNAPENTVVKFYKPGRTIPQNDRMWAALTDISKQVTHNGKKFTPEQWKALFMHACGHEVAFMAGLSGEPFPIGFRSSNLTKEQMSELIEFINAWSADNGVKLGVAL